MLQIVENDFLRLVAYVKENYGINLIKKKTLIESRLSKILMERDIQNYNEYLNMVMSDKTGKELTEMMNKLTTNLTYFMREAEHFNYFSTQVIPWIKANNNNKDLRIWSAGCSTGEEPYTLAMYISDQFKDGVVRWERKVLATDLSERALNIAKSGVYPGEDVRKLPPQWVNSYLKKMEDDKYEFEREIKDNIIFSKFNLMEETFPFKKKFQVIFCRNVMIYFEQDVKDILVKKFYDCIEPGGYLFIGHSESINRKNIGFKYVMPALYRKMG